MVCAACSASLCGSRMHGMYVQQRELIDGWCGGGGAGLELRLQAADQTSDQSVEAAERLREEMQTIRKQQVRSRCHQINGE